MILLFLTKGLTMSTNQSIKIIFETYHNAGFKCYLVGGAVRDLLMNKTPKDYDFATNAPLDFTQHAFEHVIPTGLDHGTLTVMLDHEPFEITRFRADKNHDGRHCEIEFVDNIEDDLSRRDFTVNAIAMDSENNLVDPFNGNDDIKNHKVRFVGDAEQRIVEDYLRILRFFRFHARIAGNRPFDPVAYNAIKRNANGLSGISVERIWSEISKILVGNHGPDMIMGMKSFFDAFGFPNGNFDRLNKSHDNIRDAAVLMGMYVNTPDDAKAIGDKWKWSKIEIDTAHYVAQYHKQFNALSTDYDAKKLLVNGHSPILMGKTLKAIGNNLIVPTDVPSFPVNGADLLNMGFKSGPDMGKMLASLKSAWVNSQFKLTKDDLLKIIQTLV